MKKKIEVGDIISFKVRHRDGTLHMSVPAVVVQNSKGYLSLDKWGDRPLAEFEEIEVLGNKTDNPGLVDWE